jgi:hypothetical protein
MRYSTGQKKRSQLQGHRKRRRTFEIEKPAESGIRWTEYKTIRQYTAVGSILDECKIYGFRGAVDNIFSKDHGGTGGSHDWLTEEPVIEFKQKKDC